MHAVTDAAPVRWTPDRAHKKPAWPVPDMMTALGRGLRGRCPACGKSHIFNGYLRVVPACASCGAPLGLARADDAPPYFTIIIVGHIVVPLMLVYERDSSPPTWLMAAIFVPMTLVLSLGLLRPIKGATVGAMVKLGLLKDERAKVETPAAAE